MTLRTLVVGCGSIGSRHVRNLSEFTDVELIAHDVEPDRATAVGAEHGVQTATNLDAVLSADIDCVLVCTPPDTHLEIANAALDVGAHVFVEKPLSDTMTGTAEFVERAENTEQTVYLACNLRFHPPVVQIREWLSNDELGGLRFARLRYGNDLRNWRPTDYRDSYSADEEAGGGIIRDAVHELDLALQWLTDVETVYCDAGKISDLEINVEDTAEILLNSPDQMAEIHLDYIRPERIRTYELIGQDGIIRWVGREKNPEVSTVSLFRRSTDEWHHREYESTANEQYVAEMQDFFTCVREGKAPEMDAQRARKILRLATLARESAQSGSTTEL